MISFIQRWTRGARRAFPLAAILPMAACAVSQQQEVEMGAGYAGQIAQQMPLIKDPEVLRYINVLGDSLAHLTPRKDLTWHFAIVDSKEVNAFAVPGGYIYVNRGLIERAQNMSEVAGVIGHEIGHVTMRHSIKQMQKAQGANIGVSAACVLTHICDNGLGQSAINVAGGAVFAQFSQADEAEADAEGVKNLIAARIDPAGIPAMFRILLDERKASPGAVDAFFASHPLEESRIAATQRQIASYPASDTQGLTSDSPNFQAFKKRLASLPPSPAPKK
jgi:predicted Zn-dependent protease